ncbi:MAG: hypothetical protein P0121_16490 [Nitrospira sp.]|nr:hypothetical protein [Nitrospira sp.]
MFRYVSALVIILLSMGMGPVAALGQGNPEDPHKEPLSNPADEPPAVESEPEESASDSGEKPRRRLLKRIGPQPVTQEEREEAERLRRIAAKYGTDPTAIVGRVQLTSQYLDLPQGAQGAVTTARVDVPFRGNWLMRVDTPFLKWSDPDRPGIPSQHGLSDLTVTAAWRAYNTPEYALLAGVVTSLPTAAEPGLGLGKYTLGPTIATARFVPRWDSFLIGLLQYQTSVGGDPSRRDLSRFNAAIQVNSFWGRRWWTVVQAVWNVDFERSGKSAMTMEFEGGRNLVGRFGAYVRPGVGIWGRDVAGAYDWNIEVGIRYMFASF